MARLLVYYAHPGNEYSRVNRKMYAAARAVEGISLVDLYGEYPRMNVDTDREQQRLIEHDVILFQHPFFWYSTPSIIKEWFDLVLEHGFAFGHDGDKLKDKIMIQAITAAGSKDAYSEKGYQNFPLRSFLVPQQQTANLCQMKYAAPLVMYSSLSSEVETDIKAHVDGYIKMLEAIRDDRFDFDKSYQIDFFESHSLPIKAGVN